MQCFPDHSSFFVFEQHKYYDSHENTHQSGAESLKKNPGKRREIEDVVEYSEHFIRDVPHDKRRPECLKQRLKNNMSHFSKISFKNDPKQRDIQEDADGKGKRQHKYSSATNVLNAE